MDQSGSKLGPTTHPQITYSVAYEVMCYFHHIFAMVESLFWGLLMELFYICSFFQVPGSCQLPSLAQLRGLRAPPRSLRHFRTARRGNELSVGSCELARNYGLQERWRGFDRFDGLRESNVLDLWGGKSVGHTIWRYLGGLVGTMTSEEAEPLQCVSVSLPHKASSLTNTYQHNTNTAGKLDEPPETGPVATGRQSGVSLVQCSVRSQPGNHGDGALAARQSLDSSIGGGV